MASVVGGASTYSRATDSDAFQTSESSKPVNGIVLPFELRLLRCRHVRRRRRIDGASRRTC